MAERATSVAGVELLRRRAASNRQLRRRRRAWSRHDHSRRIARGTGGFRIRSSVGCDVVPPSQLRGQLFVVPRRPRHDTGHPVLRTLVWAGCCGLMVLGTHRVHSTSTRSPVGRDGERHRRARRVIHSEDMSALAALRRSRTGLSKHVARLGTRRARVRGPGAARAGATRRVPSVNGSTSAPARDFVWPSSSCRGFASAGISSTTPWRFGSDSTFKGTPSRARVSPDGRLAAFTVFVRGDSYAKLQFSTRTRILDSDTGQTLADLEDFEVLKDGAHA